MSRDTRWIGALVALPLVLSACVQQPPPPPAPVVLLNPADAVFANAAAESGLFALQSSQIAAQRSNRPGIQEFAQSVVDDEVKSAASLLAATKPHAFSLPQFLTPEQRRTVDEMQTVSPGAPLARMYFIGFVRDRTAMLRQSRVYAVKGTDPALRAYAEEQVTVIRDQLARARRIPRDRGD